MLRFALALATLLALGPGCSFSTDVPAGRAIACSATSAACPSGYACRPALGRCVSLADLALPPAGVTDPQVSPAVGNAQTQFAISFQVSGPLAGPPTAYATALRIGGGQSAVETYPFACDACSPGSVCACRFTPDPAHLPPEGPLSVRVAIVDAVGNAPPPANAGTVVLDLTPPGLTRLGTLTLTAPPGVSVPVESLAAGAGAEICFAVDEPLASDPVVVAGEPDTGALSFSLESGFPQGLRYCYQATLGAPGNVPEGTARLTASLVDVAGNPALRNLLDPAGPGLVVDTVAPAPPDFSEAAGLRYHRAPFGEGVPLSAPSFSLSSAGAAFAEAGTLLVYADSGRVRELARARVAAGRLDPPLPLPPPDLPTVYVDLLDLAGNPAAGGPFAVKSVDYVATLGLKQAGDDHANPHSCFGRQVAGPALLQADDALTGQDARSGPVASADGGGAQVRGSASWRQRFATSPLGLGLPEYGAFAYDSARGQVVAALYQDNIEKTWAFDGVDWWEHPGLVVRPGFRTGAAMDFDPHRGRAVLFGGLGQRQLCDTWEWDGQAWHLEADCGAGGLSDGGQSHPGPSPRVGASLAYDPQRGRTVLLGGEDDNHVKLDDAWEWDGQGWSRLDTGGLPPRSKSALAFLPTADGGGELVRGGGYALADGGGPFDDYQVDETWVGRWNGSSYAWTAADPGTACSASDSECIGTWLAVDPTSGSLARLTDREGVVQLHTWTGTAGAPWQAGSIIPTAHEVFAFLAGPAFGSSPFLLFAVDDRGSGTFDPSTLLCSLDNGGQCAQTHGAYPPPSGRFNAGLGMGPNGTGLLVGGVGVDAFNPSGFELGDFFVWNGFDWTTSFDSSPPGRDHGAIAYLGAGHAFWLVNGEHYPSGSVVADAWAYTPNTKWVASTSPPGVSVRSRPNLANVPDAGGFEALLLTGNTDNFTSGDTVLLRRQGSGLSGQSVADAPPEGNLAYDPVRGTAVTVAVGNPDLWELAPGAATWSKVLSGVAPEQGLPVFDSARGLLEVVDTINPQGAVVQQWDGTSLSPLPLADPQAVGLPPQRYSASMAYDPARAVTLLFGGSGPSVTPLNDTWELSAANTRPAETCRLSFGAAGAGPGAVLTGVSVQASATGARQLSGSTSPAEVVLQLWQSGSWVEAARCPASGCGSGGLQAQITDPAQAARLIGDLDTLGVQVQADAANGAGVTVVGVQSLQAVFSYRLP